jgi:membrane peptidoglycan carboxypeptidase
VHHEPVLIERVEDARGNVIYRADSTPEQVISPEIADTVTTALEGVISGGTGTAAALSGWETAGKTGTTQSNKDAWFVGYTCKVTAAVWIGNVGGPGEEIEPLPGFGGTLSAPLWAEFQNRLIDNGLVENDCELTEVTDFPGRTTFENLEVAEEPPPSTATCPQGYTQADLNGDGVIESCVRNDNGGTGQPPPVTRPPGLPPPPPPPTTTKPPPTLPPGF